MEDESGVTQFVSCALVPDFSILAHTESYNIHSAHWKRLKGIVTIANTCKVSDALNVFKYWIECLQQLCEVGAVITSVTDQETKHRACLQVTGPEVTEPSSKCSPPTGLRPSGSSRIHRIGQKNRSHHLHDRRISSSHFSLHTINYTLL